MVSYIKVEVPELYPYVLYVTGIVAFECFLFSFLSNAKRKNIYPKEFMEQFNA